MVGRRVRGDVGSFDASSADDIAAPLRGNALPLDSAKCGCVVASLGDDKERAAAAGSSTRGLKVDGFVLWMTLRVSWSVELDSERKVEEVKVARSSPSGIRDRGVVLAEIVEVTATSVFTD
jgi:hypothetical protein